MSKRPDPSAVPPQTGDEPFVPSRKLVTRASVICFLAMSESFPEQVRGVGSNVAHTMGPVGAIAGSALLGALLSAGASMTTAAFVAGAIGIFGSGLVMLGARNVDHRGAPAAA